VNPEPTSAPASGYRKGPELISARRALTYSDGVFAVGRRVSATHLQTPPQRPQVECEHCGVWTLESSSSPEACLVRVGRLIPFPRMADLGAAAGRGGDDAMDAAAGPPTAAEVEAAPVPDGNQPRDTACASFPFPIGVFCVCLFSFWGFADARCFS
jgi:hypothetical protein